MIEMRAPNPFAASRTRPGTLPFIFESGDLDNVVARFQCAGRRGQIVGPHGSGKTTLLLAIVHSLRAAGQPVLLVRLPARNDPRFPDVVRHLHAAAQTLRTGTLVVDGWDQLSVASRFRLATCVYFRRLGILITSHRPARLPLLAQTSITLQTARHVVSQLLDRSTLDEDSRERLETAIAASLPELLRAHGGNLREVLFALYDRYDAERDRPPGGAIP